MSQLTDMSNIIKQTNPEDPGAVDAGMGLTERLVGLDQKREQLKKAKAANEKIREEIYNTRMEKLTKGLHMYISTPNKSEGKLYKNQIQRLAESVGMSFGDLGIDELDTTAMRTAIGRLRQLTASSNKATRARAYDTLIKNGLISSDALDALIKQMNAENVAEEKAKAAFAQAEMVESQKTGRESMKQEKTTERTVIEEKGRNLRQAEELSQESAENQLDREHEWDLTLEKGSQSAELQADRLIAEAEKAGLNRDSNEYIAKLNAWSRVNSSRIKAKNKETLAKDKRKRDQLDDQFKFVRKDINNWYKDNQNFTQAIALTKRLGAAIRKAREKGEIGDSERAVLEAAIPRTGQQLTEFRASVMRVGEEDFLIPRSTLEEAMKAVKSLMRKEVLTPGQLEAYEKIAQINDEILYDVFFRKYGTQIRSLEQMGLDDIRFRSLLDEKRMQGYEKWKEREIKRAVKRAKEREGSGVKKPSDQKSVGKKASKAEAKKSAAPKSRSKKEMIKAFADKKGISYDEAKRRINDYLAKKKGQGK